MPRRVEVSVDAGRTQALVQQISGVDGMIGLQVQRGASRVPPGDVITVAVTNRGMPELMRLFAEEEVGRDSGISISTSEPLSIVASSSTSSIVRDSSESSWEEMEAVMAKNSNMTVNATIIMAIAGVLATLGLATNALHIVIGAMLIAPGSSLSSGSPWGLWRGPAHGGAALRTCCRAMPHLPPALRARPCCCRPWAGQRSAPKPPTCRLAS